MLLQPQQGTIYARDIAGDQGLQTMIEEAHEEAPNGLVLTEGLHIAISLAK